MDFTLQDGSLLNPNAVPVEHPSIDKLDTLLGKHPLDALTAAAEFADKFPDGLIPIESTDKLPPHLLPTDMTGVQAKVQEFENLKRLIEKGGAIPLEYDTPYSSSSSASWQNRQSELINNPAVKYDNLRIECKMLALEKIIKDSLTMSKMNFPRALSRIDAMMFLDISSQMLIKNPEVIDTFRRLQRFNVHRELSGISNEDDFTVAQIQAALIRFGAERVCEKFAALFDIPPGKSFYEVYCADYEQRKSTGATKHKS
ncbi:uncharacterized protein LOC103507198 [Diaphorina citri]|uniref:Uncharacterized protein LOC103507198 n=1 Tax=Diaphorina citri TaxID=121845 RepID=A0A3Q0INQ5_DIACI|nr:uncharacterized protein LOC103507198 [Diaphorina citri]